MPPISFDLPPAAVDVAPYLERIDRLQDERAGLLREIATCKAALGRALGQLESIQGMVQTGSGDFDTTWADECVNELVDDLYVLLGLDTADTP